MADENNEAEIKVTDRRRFTAEGEPVDTSDEEPAATKGETAAESSEAAAGAADGVPVPAPTFEFLVLSLRLQAEVQLGLYGCDEKQRPPDLEAARHSIDLLGMLQEKTRGNLSLDEKLLLENSLTELRFRYVQAVDQFAKKK